MKKHTTIFHIFLWLFLSQTVAFAQFPGGGGRGIGSTFSGSGGSSGPQTLVLDTSAIYHFYAENPNLVFPYRDSLIDNFQQYDPTRQQDWDWMSLGHLGSAARPIVHTPQFRQGVDIGLHQYDLYQLRTEDVRFYKIRQSYTQALFSQGANQSNALFNVRFSRTFKKGLNLTIEHRRINDSGYFDHESGDHRAFALGLWYKTQRGGYEGFLTFTANSSEVEDNGGENIPFIQVVQGEDTLQVPDFEEDAFLLDINTNSANTRHTNREFAYTQYLYLNKRIKRSKKTKTHDPDSLLLQQYDSIAALSTDTLLTSLDSLQLDSISFIKTDTFSTIPSFPKNPLPPLPSATSDFSKKRAFTVYHQLKYATETYKFWDERSSFDTVYYQNLQVDSRGLRYFLERKLIENTFKLQTFKLRKDEANRRIATQKDLIEVGLKHQIHFIDQDGLDTASINNLYLTGSLNFTPSERLKINTFGQFALLENAGDYRISGELFFDLKTIGNLRIEAVNQLYEPTFVQHRFHNTEREIWKNNFDKTLETSISGTYSIPSLQLSINGGYHLLTNYVYFDTMTVARQSNNLINIFQIGLSKNFQFGPVHFNNQIIFQKSTSDLLPLPEIYSKHSLFIEGPLFKNALTARLGIDARLWTSYRPYTYQPLTGQFHLQDSEELPFTPLIDAFFVAKLTRFRFFFKIENLLSAIQREYYSQTAGYIQPYGFSNSGGMRLGISWRFVD